VKDFAALECVWFSSNARVSWVRRQQNLYFAKITAADQRASPTPMTWRAPPIVIRSSATQGEPQH